MTLVRSLQRLEPLQEEEDGGCDGDDCGRSDDDDKEGEEEAEGASSEEGEGEEEISHLLAKVRLSESRLLTTKRLLKS